MPDEGFTRKLAAIFSADAVGYSRLMGDDEEATIRTLTEYRETIIAQVKQHKGRVVDSPGDNVLAEFASVVDAVRCAVETQKQIAERNSGLPENRQMLFRIGVNLGDIVDEGERIYGDGVNITARLESLADGGGICISGTAFDQVKGKLDVGYKYLGEQSVKNIKEPVRVYQMLLEPDAAGKVISEKKSTPVQRKWAVVAVSAIIILLAGAYSIWNFYFRPSTSSERLSPMLTSDSELSKIPSVAVLPFDNLSDDLDQAYFTDGMTDDLITGLSKLNGLLVIARNSTFTYKGKSVKVQQVAKDLGVRYVVEGSVRRAGEQVRINVQLIDAASGHHLWAERYDGKMTDIFALQDQINQKIISTLMVKLTAAEKSRIAYKETSNLKAYDAFLRGWEHYKQMTPEDFSKASSYFKKAINLDPIYARAYAALALLYLRAVDIGWDRWVADAKGFQNIYQVRLDAKRYLKMAMKDPTALAHQAAALTLIYNRLFSEAVTAAENARTLDPNDAYNYFIMAKILNYAGQSEKAVDFAKRAIRLDPHYPADYLTVLGESNFALGNLEEAVIYFEKSQSRSSQERPNKTLLENLVATYSHLGRIEEADELFQSLKNVLLPPISLRRILNFHPYNTPEVTDRLAQGLIKAGMPKEVYYTVSDDHRLDSDEISALIFGRTMQVLEPTYGVELFFEIAKDGKATRSNDNGRFWIDKDMLCFQWQKPMNALGAEWCGPVFKNPRGSPETSDEYLQISDFGISPFTLVD
ncbi:MAG: adenylate/guanylate cyclase domain-containing protein [Desulfobacterales bacterium]|jgi:TolB-like protein/class 3 adenylate cyclase